MTNLRLTVYATLLLRRLVSRWQVNLIRVTFKENE